MTLVATQVKRRRGTTAENDAFTGAEGEITVDLTTHELRVHDGSTVGGHTIPTKNYGYSKTESDNLLSNKANVGLDNLTTSGKNKLGADILRSTGMLLNSSGDTVEGIGIAEVYLYKNGVAKIEFAVQISQAGTSGSAFNWGINRDLLKLHNANIPTITPSGGVVTFFNSSGNYSAGLNGYGGGASPVSQFWQLGRIYNTSGGYGGWPASEMQINVCITGTLWGTYTV